MNRLDAIGELLLMLDRARVDEGLFVVADIRDLLAVAKAVVQEMSVRACPLCGRAWTHEPECPMVPLLKEAE